MKPEYFIEAYQTALRTQKWSAVAPLIANQACVTFSDGTIHFGKNQVQIAFERNFSIIKGDQYRIDQVKWLKREKDYAVYIFEFYWAGSIDGTPVSGNGIGTSVIIKERGLWKLLAEHLGSK